MEPVKAPECLTKTLLLRCSAVAEFGLRTLPQGRCSFGAPACGARTEATCVCRAPQAGAPR